MSEMLQKYSLVFIWSFGFMRERERERVTVGGLEKTVLSFYYIMLVHLKLFPKKMLIIKKLLRNFEPSYLKFTKIL